MTEVKQIVELLNKELGTSYTMVTFDELKDRKLVGVVNDLFANLTPHTPKVELSDEDPAYTGQRLADFVVHILHFKCPPHMAAELLPGLTNGDPKIVYPVLHWVLTRMPENRKKVYLSKYLIPVNVPDDLTATDDQLREVFNQYKTLKQEFIAYHKEVERLKGTSVDPAELSKNIKNLEADKEQLTGKVQTAKKRFDDLGVANKDKFLAACKEVRKSQEELDENKARMVDQKEQLKQVERQAQTAAMKLKAATVDLKDSDPSKIISKLKEDLQMNKLMYAEKMPKDLELKRDQLASLQRVMNTTVDVEVEKKAVAELQKEIQQIMEKYVPKLTAKEEQALGLFRQQAALVNKRKANCQVDLDKLDEEKLKQEQLLQGKESEIDQYKGSKILRGDDFKKYANSLRNKSTEYKRKKAEAQELRSEFGMLQRTEELLKTRDDDLEGFMTDMEKRKGVQGFRETTDTLVQVAQKKMEIDELKGETLDQLSKIVQEFVGNIREKRNKLAPQILELRNTRTKAQGVEQEYQTKKESYDSALAHHQAEISKLQMEVNEYTEEAGINESLYHRLHCQILIAEVANRRVSDEKEFKMGTRQLDARHKSYTVMFENEVNRLEAISKDLRERKRDIEENHGQNLTQMGWFTNLKKLLDSKLAYYKRESMQGTKRSGTTGDGLDSGIGGVDRLVL